MQNSSLIFVYTLTQPEFRHWTLNPIASDGKPWRNYIERVVRFKARAKHKKLAMVVAPDGNVLVEFHC